MNKKIKLTELSRLDNLHQRELLEVTGGAAPGSGCCCDCDACSCTPEGCDENDNIASDHNKNSGGCGSGSAVRGGAHT